MNLADTLSQAVCSGDSAAMSEATHALQAQVGRGSDAMAKAAADLLAWHYLLLSRAMVRQAADVQTAATPERRARAAEALVRTERTGRAVLSALCNIAQERQLRARTWQAMGGGEAEVDADAEQPAGELTEAQAGGPALPLSQPADVGAAIFGELVPHAGQGRQTGLGAAQSAEVGRTGPGGAAIG